MSQLSRRQAVGYLAALGSAPLYAGLPKAARTDVHPQMTALERKTASEALLSYFITTGPKLLRPATGILQHPWIALSLPGREYSASLWDWDLVCTTRGLLQLANLTNNTTLRDDIVLHAQGSLFNFLDQQSHDGRLPIMISGENPDPFGCLSDSKMNMAKPVMAQLALLIADASQRVDWLASRFDVLLRFYAAWEQTNSSQTGLFVWSNDVAIGDDNDPTTFGRPPFSSANILLNCFMYEEFNAAAELATRLGRSTDAAAITAKRSTLGESIQKHCWDPRDRFYYTADVQCIDRRAELIHGVAQGMPMSWSSLPLRIQMYTGFLPLWCGLATREQAQALLEENYLRDDRFRATAGVRSLSSHESMYSLVFSSNPSNWLGPVWILVNYLVWKGLTRYQFHDVAAELAEKTIRTLAADLQRSGSLNEYYHPDTGASLSHAGFMDWNLLVLEML